MAVARRIQECAERAGLPGTMIFLDWEKAFDKVDQQMMFKVMESYRISGANVDIRVNARHRDYASFAERLE